MGNLRRSFIPWDWEIFNGCFGETKIKLSDIDGIVERKGNFLAVEKKHPGESMQSGQRFTLEAFVKQGHHVLVLEGKSEWDINHVELWTPNGNGVVNKYLPKEQNTSGAQEVVSKWFDWANSNPRDAAA